MIDVISHKQRAVFLIVSRNTDLFFMVYSAIQGLLESEIIHGLDKALPLNRRDVSS